jgi:hypothetical protein
MMLVVIASPMMRIVVAPPMMLADIAIMLGPKCFVIRTA